MNTRGVGSLASFASDDGSPQYWLHLPLAEGWTAAYRVTIHGRGLRTRLGELRIVPGKGSDFDPTRDYAVWESEAQAAGRTVAPFPFDAVRRGITARRFRDLVAAGGLTADEPAAERGEPTSRVSSSPTHRGVGRPARPRIFYATFAVRYHQIEQSVNRDPGTSTRTTLARRYNVPLSTIGKWILTARQLGFLTATIRGSRGGFATAKAKELCAREPTPARRRRGTK